MSEQIIAQLEGEIKRLNQIITVLLEQNERIKEDYSLYREKFEGKTTLHSPSEFLKTTNQANNRQSLQGSGMSTATHSLTEQGLGVNQATHSHSEQEIGISQKTHSLTEQGIGVNQPLHSLTEASMPLNQAIQSNPPQTVPPKHENELLPQKLEATTQLISSVASTLVTQKHLRAGNDTPQAAAKLLIHFNNGGSGLYTELLQLTGYSQGGLAKLLMALRKKGLIIRAAFQRYVLSETGKKILQQAIL